jgi:hypothetical protein
MLVFTVNEGFTGEQVFKKSIKFEAAFTVSDAFLEPKGTFSQKSF